MKTMRHVQTWLLITLLTLSANGDVWGKRLETNWNGSEVSESQTQGNQRGYTDHEHLDSIGLIHMNGRVYDPKLARFISPDPYIQDPYNTQSFNRYSYVWNNPLRHTDPTGEFIPLIIAGIKIAGLAYGVYEAAEVARGIATGEITGQEAVTGAVITAGIGVVGGAIVKLANKVTPPVVEEQIKDVVDKALRKNTDAQQNLSDKPTRTADAPDGRGGNNDVEVNDNVNGDASKGVTNPVPGTLARVVPDTPITRASGSLGRPGADDVFVTAADDIRGLNARQIADRLTIGPSPTGVRIIEFPAPSSGIASPVLRNNPGFVGGGRTAGGAREFVIPNQSIPSGASTRVVP